MPRRSVRFGPANASDDLEQRTLRQIPTLYARLCYLASLRNANTGTYRHHGLELLYGRQDSDAAIRAAHERIFREWLGLSMQDRFADLSAYLDSIQEDRRVVMDAWNRTHPFRTLVPAAMAGPEKLHFCGEMETLLAILSVEAGASGPDRLR